MFLCALDLLILLRSSVTEGRESESRKLTLSQGAGSVKCLMHASYVCLGVHVDCHISSNGNLLYEMWE